MGQLGDRMEQDLILKGFARCNRISVNHWVLLTKRVREFDTKLFGVRSQP